MNTKHILTLFLVISVFSLLNCGKRPRQREAESDFSKRSIKSIPEEYKSIDKECNAVEVKIDYIQSSSKTEIQDIRNQIRMLRLAVRNLVSECKAAFIAKPELDGLLAKDGVNMLLIEQLEGRIEKISKDFEAKVNENQATPIGTDSL